MNGGGVTSPLYVLKIYILNEEPKSQTMNCSQANNFNISYFVHVYTLLSCTVFSKEIIFLSVHTEECKDIFEKIVATKPKKISVFKDKYQQLLSDHLNTLVHPV